MNLIKCEGVATERKIYFFVYNVKTNVKIISYKALVEEQFSFAPVAGLGIA